jgi:hypothetical protein
VNNTQLSILLRNYHRRLITGINQVKDSLPADMFEKLVSPTGTYKHAKVLKDINEFREDWGRELIELGSCPSGGTTTDLQLGIFLETYIDRLSVAIRGLKQNLPDSLVTYKDILGKTHKDYACLDKLLDLESSLSITIDQLSYKGAK